MNDILAKVQEAFHLTFRVEHTAVNMDTNPDHIKNWDSMGHVALVASLERAFDVSFDVDDVMEMENVQEILRIVELKINHD
jgi:acyl carrier protein